MIIQKCKSLVEIAGYCQIVSTPWIPIPRPTKKRRFFQLRCTIPSETRDAIVIGWAIRSCFLI